jgi:hypothetical protein
VLLVSDADLADARGTVYENHWHQLATWDGLQSAGSLARMVELAGQWKLQYLIGRSGAADLPEGLRLFLGKCTEREYEHGGVYLAKVRACEAQ